MKAFLGAVLFLQLSNAAEHTVQSKPTGIQLNEPRQIFTLTHLNGKSWLVAGGHLEKDPNGISSNSAEILKIESGNSVKSVPVESYMKVKRWGHRATRLSNGDVFICGGSKETLCEKYVYSTQKFIPAGQLKNARSGHSQILLPNDNVLITGGYNTSDLSMGKYLKSAELYDPISNTVKYIGDTTYARAGHTIFSTKKGIFLVGGLNPESAYVGQYDWKTQKFSGTTMKLPDAFKDFQHYQEGNIVYIFGGTNSSGNSVTSIYKLDFDKKTVEEMPGKLGSPREDMALCANQNKRQLLLLGGENKGNGQNGTHSGLVELVTLSPFSIKAVPVEMNRDDAQTIPLSQNSCLVIGGTNQSIDVQKEFVQINY